MSDNKSYAGSGAYTAGLRAPLRSLYKSARAPEANARASDVIAPQFVYSGLTSADLNYDSSEYPQSGTFGGVLPPWIDDINAVPQNWQATAADSQDSSDRQTQVSAAMSYIANHVPGQQYSGTTTAQIIEQYFTQGMWDPSIFSQQQVAALTGNWVADDGELARQRLGSANPNVIKLADAASYDIAAWTGAASNGAQLSTLRATLSAAQSAGALFVCDYRPVLGAAVTGQLVRKGSHLAAPLCFFTIDASGTALTPQAIQISATDSGAYIFTPADAADPQRDAWLLAKLWVASSDQQWWFSGSHLFNTHTIDMLFGTAALNQILTGVLPANHALVILAKPYLQKSFNINSGVIGMKADISGTPIYQKGSFCDNVLPTGRIGLYSVISSLYQNYRFDDNAFPAQISKRGLNSGPITKVVFPYRDDGQRWWTAVNNFVSGIVNATYANDSAVAADAGLNGWMNAVQAAFNHDGATRFTWTPSVACLNSVFSNLLFTCSVQHTAVNNTMFNAWGFIPNGAFAMQAPPPANAAAVSRQTVLASLPNPAQVVSDKNNTVQPQISFVMSGTSVVSETLGVTSASGADMQQIYPYAAGSPQQAAVGAFWNEIWQGPASVTSVIGANQQARVASWRGATPVPNSLAYYYLSANLVAWQAPQHLNAATTNAIQI